MAFRVCAVKRHVDSSIVFATGSSPPMREFARMARQEEDPECDFFISYSDADVAWAEWIAWELEDAGYTTVFEPWDFRPGSNFARSIEDGLRRAEWTIALLSAAYFQSPQDELAAALTYRRGIGEKFIPSGSKNAIFLGYLEHRST